MQGPGAARLEVLVCYISKAQLEICLKIVKGYRIESYFDQPPLKGFFPSTSSISGEVQGTQKVQILGAEPLSQASVIVLITGTIPSIPTEESKGMQRRSSCSKCLKRKWEWVGNMLFNVDKWHSTSDLRVFWSRTGDRGDKRAHGQLSEVH